MENTQELSCVKGRIFNIQRFSLHDGPGVRTIVFLKGCPLRCAWCCNPESQSFEIEQINTAGILKTVGEDRTAGEILDEVERDRVYYRRSDGGGLTLSGGECLVQHEFSLALLALAKERGISTAIETTGFAKAETIKKLLPYVDTVLMDIKHMNGEKHKEYTGVSNEIILENINRLCNTGADVTVRTPIIPGFNDTREDVRDISRFAATLKGVKEHHLLPFHRLGKDKYEGLGRKYAFGDTEPPTKEKMEYLLSVAQESGLKCQIGG